MMNNDIDESKESIDEYLFILKILFEENEFNFSLQEEQIIPKIEDNCIINENDVAQVIDIAKHKEKSECKSSSKVEKYIFINKKLGRCKKSNRIQRIQCGKIHDRNTSDNILKKILVRYLNFIIMFLNSILSLFKYKETFLKLEHNFTSSKKEYLKSLKKLTIGKIILNKISGKYSSEKANNNINLYRKLKNHFVLKKIFEEKYLKLFPIYFRSQRVLNLKEYGLDQDIVLDKRVKMFDYLLEKVKDDVEYRSKIITYIETNLIDKVCKNQ